MESYIFRTMESMGATSADFVIMLMGLVFAGIVYAVTHFRNIKIEALEVLIKEHNETHHKHRQLESKLSRDALAEAVALIDNRIKGLGDRYHRQDALQYGMAKVIRLRQALS